MNKLYIGIIAAIVPILVLTSIDGAQFKGGLMGALNVSINGTFEERHAYGKGKQTKFGALGFDSEAVLKGAGLSDSQVHELGYALGWSKLRPTKD